MLLGEYYTIITMHACIIHIIANFIVIQHAAYSEATGYYMFFRNRRRRSVPSAIKPLKTDKAHLVQIIAAKPAEAAPGQDSVISVDECAYTIETTVGCATNSPRKRLITQQLHS